MLELVALRARPDLLAQVFATDIQGTWPEFMQHDATAHLYFGKPHLDTNLDTAFAVVDPARPDLAVGRAFAVPFAFADVPGRAELPDAGWDGVIRWAHQDRTLGRPANAPPSGSTSRSAAPVAMVQCSAAEPRRWCARRSGIMAA
jgi:hypothetical protein